MTLVGDTPASYIDPRGEWAGSPLPSPPPTAVEGIMERTDAPVLPIEGSRFTWSIDARLVSRGLWEVHSYVYQPDDPKPLAGFRTTGEDLVGVCDFAKDHAMAFVDRLDELDRRVFDEFVEKHDDMEVRWGGAAASREGGDGAH